jgi:diaminopimelate epimerase
MEILFIKMQGNGNDFILIDELKNPAIPDEMKGQFARLYCNRRFGIGADGVLFLSNSAASDFRMRIFQPDESEAEMCGNGIRCFAKYLYDAAYVKNTATVETVAGEIAVEMGYEDDVFSATITMPTPAFERRNIPATGNADADYFERIADYEVYAVNVGVPHAVVFVDEIAEVPLRQVAPIIRSHATFPQGANVNFVEVTGESELHIRTFERGIEEETLSCGTGATASAAVAHRLGYPGNGEKRYIGTTVEVLTSGGLLTILLDDETRMQGAAATVFEGIISF